MMTIAKREETDYKLNNIEYMKQHGPIYELLTDLFN